MHLLPWHERAGAHSPGVGRGSPESQALKQLTSRLPCSPAHPVSLPAASKAHLALSAQRSCLREPPPCTGDSNLNSTPTRVTFEQCSSIFCFKPPTPYTGATELPRPFMAVPYVSSHWPGWRNLAFHASSCDPTQVSSHLLQPDRRNYIKPFSGCKPILFQATAPYQANTTKS